MPLEHECAHAKPIARAGGGENDELGVPVGIPMDSLITASPRVLAAGDPLGALNRIACATTHLRSRSERCIVAQAKIALVSRHLSWPAKPLDALRVTLDQHGAWVNAPNAR